MEIPPFLWPFRTNESERSLTETIKKDPVGDHCDRSSKKFVLCNKQSKTSSFPLTYFFVRPRCPSGQFISRSIR